MCTRGREARVCLQRNEAFTVSQTHTGQWLPVNESFIPVCLLSLTHFGSGCPAPSIVSLLLCKWGPLYQTHYREKGAEARRMPCCRAGRNPGFACSWEFLKTWGRVVFFPSLDTQFTAMNRSRCTHTRTDCHTHTHNKNSHLPIIRFCYRLGKRLPQECPVCKWYKNFMYQKRGF